MGDKEFEQARKEMMGEIKSSEQVIGEVLGDKKFITLEGLHNKYKELLYIEDTKRIDIILATALSSNIKGESPIWIILVGASGDMKSVQLNAIKGYNTFYLHKITSKTLVNGFRKKDLFPDLAPQLDGKIIVIRDLAPLLKLNPTEKGEIWGQLRDLYDGFAGASSGMGMDVKYENIDTTLLAGSTPSIDGQILIHQDLGTRELIYRTEGNKSKIKAMNKCMDNEEIEKKITKELNEITLAFLNSRKIKRDFISDDIKDEIMRVAEYLSLMRAVAEIDSYEKSLRSNVIPEEPTRIVKQLKKIYVCLMSLADDYPSERALEILWHIARSSASQIRIELVDFFLNNPNAEFSTSKLAEIMKKGKGTIQVETGIIWNLGILNLRKSETNYPDRFYDYWSLNPNYNIYKLNPTHSVTKVSL